MTDLYFLTICGASFRLQKKFVDNTHQYLPLTFTEGVGDGIESRLSSLLHYHALVFDQLSSSQSNKAVNRQFYRP